MVKLAKDIERHIRYVVEKVFPEEGCGIILGVSQDGIHHVREIIELTNVATTHRDERYDITPQQYRQSEKTAKAKNLALLGLFHSHPNHRPEPSAYDLEHALPSFLYLIVAVMGGVSAGLTAWMLAEHRHHFDQLPIEIV